MFDSIKAACTTRNLLILGGVVAVGAAVAYFVMSDDKDAGEVLVGAVEGTAEVVGAAVEAAVDTATA